jgi:hypothetical protein
MNWTCDGIQFSVDNPYLVLLTVADIDTLSIENCEVNWALVIKMKDASNTFYACFHLFFIGNNNQTHPILID